MNKPSLGDFNAPAIKTATTPKPTRNGEELVAISIRMTRSEWLNLVAYTARERTKIQPYVLGLVRSDLAAKGLPF